MMMCGRAVHAGWPCRPSYTLGGMRQLCHSSLWWLRSFLLFGSMYIARSGVDDRAWSYPVAPHKLWVMEPGATIEMSLPGYDISGTKLKTTIAGIATEGSLYQLSKSYNDYGYEPKLGTRISSQSTEVTGKNSRLLYVGKPTDMAPYGKWDTFTYTVSGDGKVSAPGTVTLVPPSGILVGSSFMSDGEGWTVSGNKAATAVTHDPTSRGLMNRYVYGSDDVINVGGDGSDRSLWYFVAPPKFSGNHGMAYGGSLQFTLSSFSGDFAIDKQNQEAYLVLLECASCNSNAGVRLGFPLKSLPNGPFSGSDLAVTLKLIEAGGWLEDSKNTLQPWTVPSRCTFIQVLSSLSKVSILGDFTTWYESVGLDSVALVNTKGQLPMCAQGAPDAHLCTCTG